MVIYRTGSDNCLDGSDGVCLGGASPVAPSIYPTPVPTSYPAPRPGASGAFEESKSFDGEVSYENDWLINDSSADNRMIVRTGDISMVVEDIAESIDVISEMAVTLDGYVVQSRRWGENEDSRGVISVRIPTDRYDEAIDKLRCIAIEVTSESTDSRDVTEEYTDLQSQLLNLEAAEEQYLTIMGKAEKVEDILQVQRELVNVRGQIERIQGQMLYLERTSSTSLIRVDLSVERTATVTGWRANDTLKSATRGVVRFGQFLADASIWLGIFCFVWIPPLVIWLRRRRRRKAE